VKNLENLSGDDTMEKEIRFMSAVAEDIIGLKFKPKMTLLQVQKLFYKVMRKHGIKEGTKSGNGITIANFEWTMCKELFLSMLVSHFHIGPLCWAETPKDLECY